MGAIIDLTGQRIGRLTVLYFSYDGTRQGWVCQCECGEQKWVRGDHLREGRVRSCGCLVHDNHEPRWMTHGHTSGRQSTPEYKTWVNIKQRCYNPRARRFERYGGRGIKVCKRWLNSFESFLADMGNRPSPRHSIDRFPDKDGNYTPKNCRWATPSQQAFNRNKKRKPEQPNGV